MLGFFIPYVSPGMARMSEQVNKVRRHLKILRSREVGSGCRRALALGLPYTTFVSGLGREFHTAAQRYANRMDFHRCAARSGWNVTPPTSDYGQFVQTPPTAVSMWLGLLFPY
jgi:hypothetical protein